MGRLPAAATSLLRPGKYRRAVPSCVRELLCAARLRPVAAQRGRDVSSMEVVARAPRGAPRHHAPVLVRKQHEGKDAERRQAPAKGGSALSEELHTLGLRRAGVEAAVRQRRLRRLGCMRCDAPPQIQRPWCCQHAGGCRRRGGSGRGWPRRQRSTSSETARIGDINSRATSAMSTSMSRIRCRRRTVGCERLPRLRCGRAHTEAAENPTRSVWIACHEICAGRPPRQFQLH